MLVLSANLNWTTNTTKRTVLVYILLGNHKSMFSYNYFILFFLQHYNTATIFIKINLIPQVGKEWRYEGNSTVIDILQKKKRRTESRHVMFSPNSQNYTPR